MKFSVGLVVILCLVLVSVVSSKKVKRCSKVKGSCIGEDERCPRLRRSDAKCPPSKKCCLDEDPPSAAIIAKTTGLKCKDIPGGVCRGANRPCPDQNDAKCPKKKKCCVKRTASSVKKDTVKCKDIGGRCLDPNDCPGKRQRNAVCKSGKKCCLEGEKRMVLKTANRKCSDIGGSCEDKDQPCPPSTRRSKAGCPKNKKCCRMRKRNSGKETNKNCSDVGGICKGANKSCPRKRKSKAKCSGKKKCCLTKAAERQMNTPGKEAKKDGKRPKQAGKQKESGKKGGKETPRGPAQPEMKQKKDCKDKKCKKAKGKCKDKSQTCKKGDFYEDKKLCKGKNCACCIKNKHLCSNKKKCDKKGGTCQYKWLACDGEKIKKACKGSKSCVCCAPKSCKDKKNACADAGGYCLLKEEQDSCKDTFNKKSCGKTCGCCMNGVKPEGWSYHGATGPPFWGSIGYPLCNGDAQSPIDIDTSKTEGAFEFHFDFEHYADMPDSLTLTNNGHGAEVKGTWTNTPYIHNGGLKDEYELLQFHIHWGSDDSTGSEHTVDGFQYAAEVHFVHWNKKYLTVEEALKYEDGLAVLGVFLEPGAANSAYDAFFNGMANIITPDTSTDIGPFALADLLPANTIDLWRYKGSLTTPTCNEIVTWTVFQEAVEVSAEQLATLRQLTDKHGDPLVDTFRPVQPLNGRTVYDGSYDWGYEDYNGPSQWPSAYPTCEGTRQSPINIVTATAEGTYPWNDFAFYGYDVNPTSITGENNGHTAQLTFEYDSEVAFIRGGGLGEDVYQFLQLHFHWGDDDTKGSEHTVDGTEYPIELHLVHFNQKYVEASEAIMHEDGLAVLGILMEIGAENTKLDSIISGLASIQDPYTSSTFDSFPLEDLLPQDTDEFWRYKGSLTTPTCNEIVTWTVFKNTVEISSDQLAEFRKLFDSHGNPLVNNFRPPQENSQTVYGMDKEFHWSYMGQTGPAFWGDEYPLCDGDSQSPVDIIDANAEGDHHWPEWNLQNYDASATSWTLLNNKHTAQASGEFNDVPTINGGDLGEEYTFAQLHFHWGSDDAIGSEHTFDGTAYPIECHYVHFNSKYGDISTAILQPDGLAVLGIMFEISPDDNPNLSSIIDGLEDIVEPGSSTTIGDFALGDMLPNDLDFYRYQGSLTTPTCNPIVTWTVFKETVPISSAQLGKFRLLIDGDGHLMVNNFRPVQSLGDRKVEKGSKYPHWGYEGALGPANWGTAFPLCNGTSQSPIDIVTANAIGPYSFLPFNFINYDVTPTSLKLMNNGHTIQASFESSSPISIIGGDLPDEYILAQFHFHWGSDDTKGSEHLLNGQSYPMELHFVHFKEEYLNISEALMHADGLAVLGIFFEIDAADNPNLSNLIAGIPAIEQSHSETDITPFAFDQMLPADLTTFYRYSGSLTTPTCNEIVTWTVFQDTVKISASQMAQFRTVLDDAGLPIVDNFRPVQPLNGRQVYSGSLTPHWAYEGTYGPSNWGTLFPTCSGTKQSPIDIVTTAAATNTSYGEFVFSGYNTAPTSMEISNNGHSAKVSITASPMPTVSGGDLGDTYEFAQFHFHWGGNNSVGSEHTVDGASYPNELHLVHFKSSYQNLSEAVKHADGLAVLGVFLQLDAADNANLASVITGLAQVVDAGDHISITPFPLEDLLPANKKEFYRYSGSLTTPTCNEVVTWTVFKDPITISQTQLDAFRALKDDAGHPLINNFRPVQSLDGRTVTFADIP